MLSQILDSLPVFIGLVNDQMVYEFVNSTYETRFGLPRDQIIGQTVESINGSKEFERSRSQIEAVLKGEKVEFEYEYDDRIHLIKYLPRIEDAKVTGYFVISTDITKLKQATVELEENQAELNVVRSSFEDFASFAHYDRIASVGAMAVGIAHDISQPISVMNILIDSLRSSLKGTIADQSTRHTINSLQDQVHYVANLINRLRQFSTKQESHRSEFDVQQILTDCLSMVEPRIQSKDIELSVKMADQPIRSIVDPIEIQQILVNLIANAIESVSENEIDQRHIRITCEIESPDFFVYRVSDNGAGVSDEMASRLFEAFESDKESGIGMGLSISRVLASNNGGVLELVSTANVGAEFICRLPICSDSRSTD